MRTVFADTGYWIASINPNDNLHSKAREITLTLYPLKILTWIKNYFLISLTLPQKKSPI